MKSPNPHTAQTSSSWQTRYTFSGKEKDSETGYSYFGARYYDSDGSVWLSVDPMSDKFPYQSAYAYCSNNPVMMIDPNGLENIVVVGNQGDSKETPNSDANSRYGKNTRHFLEASLKYAIGLKKKDKDELTTMIVYKGDYTDDEMSSYKSRAEKAGINFIEVSDDADIADYVNKKSTFSTSNSERMKDKITDFAYFGHSDPNNMLIGYHTFWEGVERLSASSFDKDAFDIKSNIYLASCRSGLGSMYTTFQSFTSGTVTGYNVRVHWGEKVVNGKLVSGLGYNMPWPKHPDNQNVVVPISLRIRTENGKRKN